jgi:hypothetical protein
MLESNDEISASLGLGIEEYFRYHPPTTEERKAKHGIINQASLAFALLQDDLLTYKKALRDNVENKDCLELAIANAELAEDIADCDGDDDALQAAFLGYFEKLKMLSISKLCLFVIQQSRMFAKKTDRRSPLGVGEQSLHHKI